MVNNLFRAFQRCCYLVGACCSGVTMNTLEKQAGSGQCDIIVGLEALWPTVLREHMQKEVFFEEHATA